MGQTSLSIPVFEFLALYLLTVNHFNATITDHLHYSFSKRIKTILLHTDHRCIESRKAEAT